MNTTISSVASANTVSSPTSSSIGGFLHSVADRVFGPKLNADEPAPPIDRNFEVQPHVIAWPPPDDAQAGAPPADDSSGSSGPSVPQGAVPCSSVLDPGPKSGDPIACVVKNDDPNADPQMIQCDKELTVGDQSYCVPSR